MRSRLFRRRKISRAFLNYDVIFYTFRYIFSKSRNRFCKNITALEMEIETENGAIYNRVYFLITLLQYDFKYHCFHQP